MKVARVNARRDPILSSFSGVGGGTPAPALDDLTDVDTTGVAPGDTIVWDGSDWVPGTGGGGGSSIYVNVTDAPYNAVGDDTADDTAAIQAAIDDWKDAGATIFFPRGTYKITATLDVDPGSSPGMLMFLGEGGADQPASVIHQATSNTTAFKGNNNAYDMSFEDLWIIGPGSASSGAGIYGNDRNVMTRNVRVQGFFYGVRVGPSAFYSKFVTSLFYLNASVGVWLESGSNNAMFTDCRFHTNGIGLKIDGAQGVKVYGGAIEEQTSHGISVDTVGGQTTDGTFINGVYFENNGSASIKVGDTAAARGTSIISCFFSSPQTGYFIDVEAASYNSIGSCDFLGSPGSGDIRLQSGITNAVQWNNRPSGVGNTYTSTPIILETLGGGGTPATTVESETTLGISPAVGTDTEYARQDHTHGSPDTDAIKDAGRWELAVITGSPPDSLYADGDWLYIWVP